MKPRYILTMLTMLLIFATVKNYGQGSLRGTVSDSTNSERLVGANVILLGTALGSATDLEGEFRITKIPEGNYRLRISYVGYLPKEFDVSITSNKTLEFNAVLRPDIIEGEEIVVTGQAVGQVAAINQQLASNTIINVVSEQKIKELPDANAAEAIGRLPGVALQRSGGEANKVVLRGLSDKFSSITVDGIRIAATDADSRGVDLSTISQGTLAGIELYKALTPDKDADAIAGSVNLVTKKAPTERLIRLESRGAYNKLSDNWGQYDFSLRYGERFFSDILGVQLTGNIERRDRSNESIDFSWNQNLYDNLTNTFDYEISNFFLQYSNEIRKRNGISLLLDINTPDDGSIRINNIYNTTKRDYIVFSRNYPNGGGELTYSSRDREQEINTFNSSIRGDNNLFGISLNWGLSFAQSLAEFPYDYTVDFIEPSSSNSQMKSGIPEHFKGPAEDLIKYAWNNFEAAFMNVAYDRGEKNLDKEKTVFLDLSNHYNIGNLFSGIVKIGAKHRSKSRSKITSELVSPYYLNGFKRFVKTDDGIVEKNFQGTMFDNLSRNGNSILFTNFLDDVPASRDIYDKYSLNPLMNRDALRLWRSLNINGVGTINGTDLEYRRNNEADGNYYDIIERVSSAYIMNTLSFGQNVTFIAGLRAEFEDNDYKSRYTKSFLSGFPTPEGILTDTLAVHKETVLLPNFHLTYQPFDFLKLRLAAYKALARPDFNRRLVTYIARNNGTFYSGNSLTIGNPDLKAAKAWNFELNTSFFSNTIGLLSISTFYKNIEDMYHVINGAQIKGQKVLDDLGVPWKQPFNENDNYFLTYPYNSDKPTKVWGVEVEHQANLRFLPGLLQNIILSYNFTIIRSETHIITANLEEYFETVIILGVPRQVKKSRYVLGDLKQKLEGQPEFFGNFAIGYDIGGFSGRLSVFYNGEYIRSFSANRRSDGVQRSFTRWDLTIKQIITDNISVMLNLNNFTNITESTTTQNNNQYWRLDNNSEKYGLSADLGVRIEF